MFSNILHNIVLENLTIFTANHYFTKLANCSFPLTFQPHICIGTQKWIGELEFIHHLNLKVWRLKAEFKEVEIAIDGCNKHKSVAIDDLYGDREIICKLNLSN